MNDFPRLSAAEVTVQSFDQVTSTNDLTKQRLATGASQLFLITAASQRAGRGKPGRTFFSPAGSGAYFTLGLPFASGKQPAARLTVTAAVAAATVLHEHFHQPITIKWVNDLYVGNRKAVGILAEMVFDNHNRPAGVAIGWGINLFQPADQWPAEIAKQVTALSNQPVSQRERLAVIDEVAARFLDLLAQPWPAVLTVYRNHQYLSGKRLVVDTGAERISGQFEQITDEGFLCIRTACGHRVFSAGTVRVRE